MRAAIPGTFAAGDAPTGLGDDPSAREVLAPLEASQQAWLAYRQAQCDYAFETARGGTGTAAPYAQNLCLATVTLARVGFLRQALLDLDQRGE